MPAPDLSLVAQRVRAGDRAAFRALVEHTERDLYRLAARLMGSEDDGAEVLQDAYLKAYRALAEGRFDGRAELRTWLYRVVTNVALDALRRRAVRPRGTERGLERERVEPVADASLALSELGAWLEELPAEQRAALVLCSIEGLSSSEAAEVLGVSEGAVEQRLVRARVALRKRRADDDDER